MRICNWAFVSVWTYKSFKIQGKYILPYVLESYFSVCSKLPLTRLLNNELSLCLFCSLTSLFALSLWRVVQSSWPHFTECEPISDDDWLHSLQQDSQLNFPWVLLSCKANARRFAQSLRIHPIITLLIRQTLLMWHLRQLGLTMYRTGSDGVVTLALWYYDLTHDSD